MTLSAADWQAIGVTLRLALTVTLLLLLLATPLAWWLANTRVRWRSAIHALVALPLVLPPSVIGFYLLIAMGPNGPIGGLTSALGLGLLPFTFWGLVFASMVYSLPFVVQPLHAAFSAIDKNTLEAAATLGLSPRQRFFVIALPMAKAGYLGAMVLGFAHTVGEFGVVLMIGGSIPGATKVVSVQLYEHVETLAYAQAHGLALVLVAFSFAVLLLVYTIQRNAGLGVAGGVGYGLGRPAKRGDGVEGIEGGEA